MHYRLYREDASGFAILLTTAEDAAYTVHFSDPVESLDGDYAYFVVPVHPALSVNGAPVRTIRKDDDDWTFGGYAGLSFAVAAGDRLELAVGAEARFPHKSVRFDDGVVSGRVGLAEWSAFAAVALRF